MEDIENKINACPECNKPLYFKNDKGLYKCYYCKHETKEPVIRNRLKDISKRNKKRVISDNDIISRNELLHKIKTIGGLKFTMNRALISLLYLTAARVEEVVGLVNQKTRKIVINPMKVNQIVFKELNGVDYMIIERLPVYKRRLRDNKPPRRNVPIYVANDIHFIKYIKDYIKSKDPDDFLFKMSYQRAWQISNRIIIDENGRKGFNHYWRHLRLTHLVEDYGFTDLELQQFVGWSNTLMASKYTHLNWQSLANKMSQVKIK